ncbi:MAG: NAD(P)/FAD-dependent oxidoreductase [Allorhizobium sp.]
MEHFVIAGAGMCGARAAFSLRERGFSGRITLVGDEAHLPYERPPLSKQSLVEEPDPRLCASARHYHDASIDVVTGRAADKIDVAAQILTLSNGRPLRYDRLLLATGSRSRIYPGLLPQWRRYCTLRTHADALLIRPSLKPVARLLIIGGGFIGLELAATARKSGARVTLVEGLPRLLSRGVPAEIADIVAERHRAEGVQVILDAKIASLSQDGLGAQVALEDGRLLDADLVVIGIGAVPNTALAETAGLALDNGIAVDGELATSASNIFAAGDCCSFPLALYDGRRVRLESWRNALDQGNLAAANMLGEGQKISSVPWFWSDQYDLTLQIAGLADSAVTAVRRPVDGGFILFHFDCHGRLVAASGIGRGNSVARDIRLAEMLIAARSHPNPLALSAPETKLKSLLAA